MCHDGAPWVANRRCAGVKGLGPSNVIFARIRIYGVYNNIDGRKFGNFIRFEITYTSTVFDFSPRFSVNFSQLAALTLTYTT